MSKLALGEIPILPTNIIDGLGRSSFNFSSNNVFYMLRSRRPDTPGVYGTLVPHPFLVVEITARDKATFFSLLMDRTLKIFDCRTNTSLLSYVLPSHRSYIKLASGSAL
jgi:hypothetical protein